MAETTVPLRSAEWVAKRVGVSTRTIQRWARDGVIPCLRVRRTIRFEWPAVKAALASEVRPVAQPHRSVWESVPPTIVPPPESLELPEPTPEARHAVRYGSQPLSVITQDD